VELDLEPLPRRESERIYARGSLPPPRIIPARSAPLIVRDDPYLRIRRLFRSGRLARMLEESDAVESTSFADRIALLRGTAFHRLGRWDDARDEYLEALEHAQNPTVTEEAARGLIVAQAELGEWSERERTLEGLIAMLEEPDHRLTVELGVTLFRLGRADRAKDELWRVIDRFPDARIVERAERLLLSIDGRRRLSRIEERAKTIAHIRHLAAVGRTRAALAMIRKLDHPDPEIMLLEADLWAARGSRARSRAALGKLASRHPEMRRFATLRFARMSRDQFRYRRAQAEYAAVVERHPGTPEAIRAAYEAAALAYDDDDYARAADLAHGFTSRHPESMLEQEGGWLAGWAAYLAGDHDRAIEAFERLTAATGGSRSCYWLGKAYERRGDRTQAIARYRDVASRAPLTYYGLLAADRLIALGSAPTLEPLPPVPPPETVDDVVAVLGRDRPIAVDRAALLFSEGLQREGVEELLGLAEHYRTSGHTQGATAVLDLFEIFGREAWVFLLARHIAEGDDPEDLARRPYYWRVWRYAFPRPFEEEVQRGASASGVDPLLIYSVMRTESLFRPESVSPVGARGLMQLMPATARWIGRSDRRAKAHVKRYRSVESNIWLGAWYVRHLLDRFDGDVVKTLAAYNAGPGAVDRWAKRFVGLDSDELVERIPYDETRAYVRRAMESYRVYTRLHPNAVAAL
jgi:soluble lytic murein transglycosylase